MNNKRLWMLYISLFIIGDLVTTYFGLYHFGLIEKNPLADYMLSTFGFVSFIIIKTLHMALTYSVYHSVKKVNNHIALKGYYFGMITVIFLGLFLTISNIITIYISMQ